MIQSLFRSIRPSKLAWAFCLFSAIGAVLPLSAQTVAWRYDHGAGNGRSVVRVGSTEYISGSKTGTGTAATMKVVRHNGSTGVAAWSTELDKGRTNDCVDLIYDAANNAVYVMISASGDVPSGGGIYGIDWYVTRLNATTGAEQWTYKYDGATAGGNDVPWAMTLAPDGNIVAVGNGEQQIRSRVAKINSATGAEIWNFTRPQGFGDIRSYAKVACDSAGNIYAVGYVSTTITSLYATKLSSAGAVLWNIDWTSGGGDYAVANDLVLDSQGQPIIVGSYRTSGNTTQDFLVLKLNSATGAQTWMTPIAGTAAGTTDEGRVITVDASDNVYVAGYVRDTVASVPDRVAYAAKLNGSTGASLWTHRKNGSAAAGSNTTDRYYFIELSGTSLYLYGTLANADTDSLVTKLAVDTGTEQWSFAADLGGSETPNAKNKGFVVADANSVVVASEYSSPISATIAKLTRAAAAEPEIDVTQGATSVADGGSFSFGSTVAGTSVTRTFTVTNSGTAALTLSGLTPPTGFTIAQNFGSTSVAAGGTTTFQVTMTAAAASAPSGSLSFTNNDSDENPYNFTISGTVTAAPVAVSSLSRVTATPTSSASLSWTLTFPSAVTGVTASNFSLSGTAAAGATVGTPTTANSGVTWTIPVTVASTSGSLTLNLANATGLSPGISSTLPYAGDSITVDRALPDTTITATPTNPSASANASFSFSGTDTGTGVASYQVQLDGGGFATATSPRTYTGLADGSHTFQVRAVDAVGNVDSTPASFTWVVDSTGPNTTITANPTNPSNTTGASFTFTGNDGSGSGVASFQVQIDGGGFSTAASPRVYSGLGQGSHTFQVRAVDAVGNVDGTPASYTWVIDSVAPSAPVVVTPANGGSTGDTTPTISGTAEADSTVTVLVDGTPRGTATATGGNWTLTLGTALTAGSHTVKATATDAAGNTSPDSATNTFNVAAVNVSATLTASGLFSAGSTVTYTATLTNNSTTAQPDNTGNEFSLSLPPQLTLVGASATNGTAAASVGTNTVSWNGSIAGNSSVTITATATVNSGASGSISAQGTVFFDTDTNGSNESSSATDDPAVAGTANPTSFEVVAAQVALSLSGTSEPSTTGSNVTIGETLTYNLTVSLPEGATPDLTLGAVLPSGLTYVSSSFITTGFNGSLPVPTITGGTSDGADVTFTFGAISVTQDGVATNNSFLIAITARVLDVPGNVAGSVLATTATLDISGDSEPMATTAPVNVTVLLPSLAVTQQITQTAANAGDTLAMTFGITNSGTIPAHDAFVEVTLSSAVFDRATFAAGSIPAGWNTSYNASTGVLRFTNTNSGGILGGASATLPFSINVATTPTPGLYTLPAGTSQTTTLPGVVAGERTLTFTPTSDSVTIHAQPVVGTPAMVVGTVNEGVSTAYTITGTFTDADGTFTGVVDWGDSTTSPLVINNTAKTYSFTGNHTYAQSGSYNVTVKVTNDRPLTGTSATVANVVANTAPVVGTPAPLSPAVVLKDSANSFTVSGTFTDAAAALDGPFTGVVNWGDSTTSAVTITGAGNPFSYSFTGSHTYTTSGTKTVTVSITDKDGSTTVSSATNVQVIGAADYAITTTGNSVAVTNPTGTADALSVTSPSAGNLAFQAAGRYFSVNGGTPVLGGSPSVSLAGIQTVTVDTGAGADTVAVGGLGSFPAALTIQGGAGLSLVQLNGTTTTAAGRALNVAAQQIQISGAAVIASGGAATLSADDLAIDPTATLSAASEVTVLPLTAGRGITLGAEAPGRLSLTGAELGRITGPSLAIGVASSGAIQVVSPLAHGSVFRLATGSAVTSTAGSRLAVPALSIRAGLGIGTMNQMVLTQTAKLEARAESGNFYINNIGGLQIGGVDGTSGLSLESTATSILHLLNQGSVRISEPVVSSGTVFVKATGATSDISVEAGINGVSAALFLQLEAERDLLFGASFRAGDAVSVQGSFFVAGNDVIVDSTTFLLSPARQDFDAGRDFKVTKANGAGSVVQGIGSGDVDITAGRSVIVDSGVNSALAANGGTLRIKTDLITLGGTETSPITANGLVWLSPSTPGKPVDLGGSTAGSLALPVSLLNRVQLGALRVGDEASGTLTVTAPITFTTPTSTMLESGTGDVVLSGGTVSTGGGGIILAALPTGEMKPVFNGTHLNLGSEKAELNGKLALTLNGTTPGTGYQPLRVTGQVDLVYATLALSGSHVPVTGDVFTLIENDGSEAILRPFSGLPEGATLTFNGTLMRISYVGGTGNDVVLGLANRAPTDIALNNASLPENAGANATVGTLSAVDPDTGDSHTFTLVAGAGGDDNGAFNISGNTLRMTAPADFEVKSSYTVRIRASDGQLAYEKAFPITITNVAENPTITAIGNLAIDEDGNTGALPFTIADQDSGSTLTVTATSDNQTLVPDANIILSGTGAARTVTVTPVANGFGSAAISVVVSDGGLTGTTTFLLTVNPVNDVPVVANGGLPDVLQVAPGQSTPLNLEAFFSDIETAPSALVYTVAPAAGTPFYTLTRSGNTLNVAGTAPGVVDITVTATDAEGAPVSDTFQLRVKHVPEIAGTGVPDTLLSPASTGLDINLANYFLDRDNDVVTYAATSGTPAAVSAEVSGSVLTLKPLAPGVVTITVTVTDSDLNEITDTFEVTVNDPVPDSTPTVSKPPVLNRQTGMWEIALTATNNNQFNIPGFRFRVTSALPAGMKLHNSTAPVGSSEAYLDVLTVLAPGQSLEVVLEFFSPTRNYAGFDPTIIAEPLPPGISNAGTGAGIDVTRFVNLPDGSKLMEFSSVAGHWYQIEYSSDLVVWKRSLVPVQAGANFTQWIDRGPPYTESHPSTVTQRYYRVSEILPE